MSYVPYKRLTSAQATAVRALHPDWEPKQLVRFEFWVKKDGTMSRKKGHHQLTADEALFLDRELAIAPSSANTGPTPTKDDRRQWTGSPAFHLGSNQDGDPNV